MSDRARSVLLTLLLVVSTFSSVGVAAAAAAPTSSPSTFHVTQGDQCYQVAAYGSGDQTVEEFYDYKKPQNTNNSTYTYSSHGTKKFQDNQVSNLFVYQGSDGYNVVLLHDELDQNEEDAPYASTITFELSNMSDADWKVRDDNYTIDGEPQDDNWDTEGDVHVIDWMWGPHRTDGGAFDGIGDGPVTISPQFNDEAQYWDEWKYSGDQDNRTQEWRLLDAGGENVSLDMQSSVTIEQGGCPDETSPSAALSANQTTVGNDEPVELDASGSSDDRGIAEYRWDFDGDGEVDRNTTDTATVTHTYESADTYDASVTVVDAAGNNDTATETITVEESGTTDPTVDVTAPETVEVGETFEVSASASDESKVESYEWEFGSETKSGSSATHSYSETGNHTVTLTWTDTDGDSHTETVEIEATDSDGGNGSSPTVEDFRLDNPENRTLEVSFLGSDSITDIEVELRNDDGDVVQILGTSDFNTSDAGDLVNYTATHTVDADGAYTAMLQKAADGDGNDAADGQTDTANVSTVDGEISYVDATSVRVNGTFERVEATVGFYAQDGYDESQLVEENVSGSTLITAEDVGVNGSVITDVRADATTGDGVTDLEKEHPDLDRHSERIKPRPVTVSVENVTEADAGVYEVTFGYENPNDEALTMQDSALAGNVSGEAPQEVAPGNNTFDVTWTPDTGDARATWTLNRSNFDQSDVSVQTKTADELGGTGPEIEFVNESAVEVTGDFDAVELTTTYFTADGEQTATHTFENVSETTLLTAPDEGDWGPVVERAAAFENASDADPALSADNPDYATQVAEVRPEKVSTFVDSVSEVDNDTYEVTFGYQNPNDLAMNASASAFTAGNASGEPPAAFESGRHTFTVTWTPESNQSNLVWETDLSNFGYSPSTATSPTPEQIEDGEMPPTAALTAPDKATVDQTVTLDASGSSDDGNVTEYRWDLDGDGEAEETTEEATFDHAFTSAGTYEVGVTVVDESGQTDSATETVIVEEQDADEPPTAKLTGPEEGTMSQLFYQLDASASTDDEGIAKYHWDFDGDGEIERQADAKVSFKPYLHYDEPGTYTATVTVEDTSGQNATASWTYTVVQVTPTATVTASDETVEVGEDVTFTAKNPNQAFEDLREFHWRTGDRTSPERTSQWTTSFDETGEHTVELVLKTRDGVRNTVEKSITVTADSDDNGDDGDDGDDNNDNNDNNHNNGGNTGPANPGGNNNNNDDSSDDTVSAPLRDADGRVGQVVVSASDSSADPAVDVTDSAPDGVTPPTVAEDGFAALSYLNVSGADQATFTVSKARLDASDAEPDAVSLFRYENATWTAVETAQVNETDDGFRFRANVSDGTYAVGVGEAVTSVADVSVDSQRVEAGQTVTVTASIENTGHADGTREVELTVGGEVVATKTVSVGADGTTEVTFTRTFDESGVYEVSVGGTSAEVVVEGIETQTTDDDSGAETSSETTSDNSSGVPGFGVGVSLVALLAAALLALRRQ